MIGMIAAVELSGLIGYDNQLPFTNSVDLKRFKSITMDSTLIMGRKTWEFLPQKKLPGRIIHVLHNKLSVYENTSDVLHFYDFTNAIIEAKTKDIWIAGGRQIYQEAISRLIPEIIDLTIHNYVWLPPISDRLRVAKEKSVYLPEISYFYAVQSEMINQEDSSLIHRKYVLRNPERWGTDWIEIKSVTEEKDYYRKHGTIERFKPDE